MSAKSWSNNWVGMKYLSDMQTTGRHFTWEIWQSKPLKCGLSFLWLRWKPKNYLYKFLLFTKYTSQYIFNSLNYLCTHSTYFFTFFNLIWKIFFQSNLNILLINPVTVNDLLFWDLKFVNLVCLMMIFVQYII